MDERLKAKTRSALKWNGINQIVLTAIKTLIGIILARLLLPEDFGLLGMVLVFTALGDAFVDGGFQSVLIQKKSITESDRSSIFFLNTGVAFFCTSLLFLCAPLLSQVYKTDITTITRVFSVYFVLNAFGLVQRALVQRDMNFKRQSMIQISSQLVAGSVAIIMAFYDYGVWALVAFSLLRVFLNSLFFWLSSDWTPRLMFHASTIRENWSYSGNLFGANLIAQGVNRFDQFLVGAYFNAAVLGIFYKSKDFSMMLTRMVSITISKSLFPVFSKLQEDREKFRRLFEQATVNVDVVTFSIFGLAAFMAKPMIELVLGTQWAPMVPYFQLLCLFGIVYVQNSLFINVNNSLGKTGIVFKTNLVTAILRVVTLLALVAAYPQLSPIWFILVQIIYMMSVSVYLNYFLIRKNGLSIDLRTKLLSYFFLFLLIVGLFRLADYLPLDEGLLKAALLSVLYLSIYWFITLMISKNTILHLLLSKIHSKNG